MPRLGTMSAMQEVRIKRENTIMKKISTGRSLRGKFTIVRFSILMIPVLKVKWDFVNKRLSDSGSLTFTEEIYHKQASRTEE
jgi:hypothetical protein